MNAGEPQITLQDIENMTQLDEEKFEAFKRT